jgi:hypothetical protein
MVAYRAVSSAVMSLMARRWPKNWQVSSTLEKVKSEAEADDGGEEACRSSSGSVSF